MDTALKPNFTNTNKSVVCLNDYAQSLLDLSYLEELLFQIADHQERLEPLRFPKLHQKLNGAVQEILLNIEEKYKVIGGKQS
ncbi:MAG: hypothetical protein ACK5QX_12575 [bacterium]